MTFLHGDDRFYNNIFIQNYPVEETETVEDMGFKMEDNQEVGTHVFDEYPTYDEWISHFAGQTGRHEQAGAVSQ